MTSIPIYWHRLCVLPNFIAFGFCGAITRGPAPHPITNRRRRRRSPQFSVLFGLPKYTLWRQAVTDSQVNDLQLSLLSVRRESATKPSSLSLSLSVSRFSMLLMTDAVIVAKGRQNRQMTNCIPADVGDIPYTYITKTILLHLQHAPKSNLMLHC